MMKYRADLHCHTVKSDGTYTPIELLKLAKKKHFSGISMTDHDTLDAYTLETIIFAKKIGMDLFTGVEFSTTYFGISVHVLGYGVKKTAKILSFCKALQERRKKRNQVILEKLAQHQMPILEKDLKEIQKEKMIGRPHIALAMVKKRYVKTIQEAFERFIGDQKSCFAQEYGFTSEETIDVIHASEGKAFIAHPYLIEKKGILKAILKLPFDGIECYYSRLPYEIEKKWLILAQEKGLLISGGSDFHGSIKPHVPLGCSWVDKEKVDAIFNGS